MHIAGEQSELQTIHARQQSLQEPLWKRIDKIESNDQNQLLNKQKEINDSQILNTNHNNPVARWVTTALHPAHRSQCLLCWDQVDYNSSQKYIRRSQNTSTALGRKIQGRYRRSGNMTDWRQKKHKIYWD